MEPEALEAYCRRLRSVALHDFDHRAPFETLTSQPHRTVLERAIRNVISTELSLFTFAQIIDGLPIADVAYDRRFDMMDGDHILEEIYEDLCEGAMEKAHEFYSVWKPSVLKLQRKVIQMYQASSPGSQAFNLRLIELVADSLHQIGGLLHGMNLRLHKGDIDYVLRWIRPSEHREHWVDVPPRPTFFVHPSYQDHDIYPNGVADMVGYWVEDRILGGVAVFDRRNEADRTNLPNVYWHSSRPKITYRVYQLLDDQQQAMVDFFLAESSSPPPSPCPLPILGSDQNTARFDQETSIINHQIYRDIWERKPLTRQEMAEWGRRPQSQTDYPETLSLLRKINAMPLSAEAVHVPPYRTPSPINDCKEQQEQDPR